MFKKKSKFIGWGLTNDQDCTTNDDGPDPYSLCKFPFYTNNLLVSDCISIMSPSGNNNACKRLSKESGGKFPPPGYSRVCI